LLGHTDLDLDTHQSRFIHGFIEPTCLGERVLPDATGVVRVTAQRPSRREEGAFDDRYLQDFRAAVDRREALDFILRDRHGNPLDFDFIRVYDLRDRSYSEPDPVEAEDLESEPVDIEAVDGGGEPNDWEADLAEDLALRAESSMYGSSWAPPEDERWETMQYYIQVYLNVCDEGWKEEPTGY
jgi:hypothetical protein